ncbi:MAG TPA: type II toxin-antitoxin system RelE/ParE family toxin [Isosphaeraceae bacterium]|nr:type II toxin-antitoxin system RelE/ParE family toxin [Isosphaeraceae bacterium]
MLLTDTDTGLVIPGCGGLRKMRVADPKRGKGKWGGARVICLHIQELDHVRLVTVYGKDKKDDVSADDKKPFRRFARILKDQARRRRLRGVRWPVAVPSHPG